MLIYFEIMSYFYIYI